MKITFEIKLDATIIADLIIKLARHDYQNAINILEKNLNELEIKIK